MTLQVVPYLLLTYHIRYLRCLAEEVKVLANRCLRRRLPTSTKGIIVESIIAFIQLIS
jgi:hypothetical protein